MLETMRERIGYALAGTPAGAPLEYGIDAMYGLLHPWLLRSGASPEEESSPMPGDDLVSEPMWTATRAETVHAPKDVVWPFVVQMGWGRGGYYGYSFFDPRHTADARGIVASLQDLKVGDVWLDGPGCDATKGAWAVVALEAGRSVVLHSLRDPITGRELDPAEPGGRWIEASRAFVVEPADPATTRLLVRTRVRLSPAWGLLPARFVLGPGDTVAQRTMLGGMRERAERAAARAAARSSSRPRVTRTAARPRAREPKA